MIYSGLEFGQYFELESNTICQSYMVAITPAVRMIFTFMQMYFIFLNSRMAISKVSLAKQFGLMHLIGTNLCVWLDVLIEETKHEILNFYDPENRTIAVGHRVDPAFKSQMYGHDQNFEEIGVEMGNTPLNSYQAAFLGVDTSRNGTILHRVRRGLKGPHSMYDCRRTNIIGSLVDSSSHFLFPCTIEYSLICAAICYVMWRSMTKRRVAKITLKRSPTADSGMNILVREMRSIKFYSKSNVTDFYVQPQGEGRSPHHYTVDCAGSNKGMFIGILFLVLTIMCLILNFVLIKHEEYRNMATLEINIAEIVLYTSSTLAVLLGMCQVGSSTKYIF